MSERFNGLQVFEVREKDIGILSEFQIRERTNEKEVKRLRGIYESGAVVDPIRLAQIGGSTYVIDGFHRLEAQRSMGRAFVRATQEPFENPTDAILTGGYVNLAHGHRLNKGDRHRLFRFYIDHGQNYLPGTKRLKTYPQIGKDFGIHPFQAQRLVQKYYPQLAKRMAERVTAFNSKAPALPEPTKPLLPQERAMRNLHNARVDFRSIQTPEGKEQVISTAEEVTAAMKQDEPWAPRLAVSDAELDF